MLVMFIHQVFSESYLQNLIPNFFKLQVMLILLVHGAYLGNKILNCCVGSIWRIVWTHEERAAGPNSDACPGNKGNVKWL